MDGNRFPVSTLDDAMVSAPISRGTKERRNPLKRFDVKGSAHAPSVELVHQQHLLDSSDAKSTSGGLLSARTTSVRSQCPSPPGSTPELGAKHQSESIHFEGQAAGSALGDGDDSEVRHWQQLQTDVCSADESESDESQRGLRIEGKLRRRARQSRRVMRQLTPSPTALPQPPLPDESGASQSPSRQVSRESATTATSCRRPGEHCFAMTPNKVRVSLPTPRDPGTGSISADEWEEHNREIVAHAQRQRSNAGGAGSSGMKSRTRPEMYDFDAAAGVSGST